MIGSRIQRYIFLRCLFALTLVLGLFAITIMLVDIVGNCEPLVKTSNCLRGAPSSCL